MKKIYALIVLTLVFASLAVANIRLPDDEKSKDKTIEAQMTIRLDRNATEAKLVIPKSRLKKLRAELEQLDNESDVNTTAAATSNENLPRMRAIIGGLFLSLAFVFGGFWFARGRKSDGKINKTIAGAIVIFVIGSAATLVFANVARPIVLQKISSNLFSKEAFGRFNRIDGNIKVQVSPTSNDIELIIPDSEKTEPAAK